MMAMLIALISELRICSMKVHHILSVGLFRSLSFEVQAVAVLHVRNCHVHMSGVSFISNQAMEGKCLSIALGILSYFFGLLYSKEMGLAINLR